MSIKAPFFVELRVSPLPQSQCGSFFLREVSLNQSPFHGRIEVGLLRRDSCYIFDSGCNETIFDLFEFEECKSQDPERGEHLKRHLPKYRVLEGFYSIV